MRTNKSYWTDFAEKCRGELLGNIMAFWMEHGWDRANGVYTCFDRDGTLMDTTKSVWAQGRFGWMTSYAFNLHRDGTVAQTAKGNLYKGPSHIPRMLVKSMDLCGGGMPT